MQDSITHFMWGYQQHFRFGLNREVERVLEKLKRGLKPEAFLIGVRRIDDDRLRPACVEPEIHHWARSEAFYDVLKDINSIQGEYAESQLMHSHPIAQANHDSRLFVRALRDAVLRCLEGLSDRPNDSQIFVGLPIQRDAFLILPVICVRRSTYEEVPSVAGDKVWLHESRCFPVPRTLVEAAIDEIFAKARAALLGPDAGAGLTVIGSADEILRAAATEFFVGLLNRLDRESLMAGVAGEVFDTIGRLSLARYEGSDPTGTIYFVDKNAAVETAVTLAQPASLRQARALRKLLVLANGGFVLRCDCQSAYGLIQDAPLDSATPHIGIFVRITGRGKWMASVSGVDLMVMTDGHPSLPNPLVDEKRIGVDLRRILPTMSIEAASSFAAFAESLAGAGHGALVVIAEDGVEEAKRLSGDGLAIQPIRLSPHLCGRLTEIDGAVLCTPDGACVAVGVVLDHIAVDSGDRGRGSRFNSALRYVAKGPARRAAMIISEDGGLDLLPKLKPVMPRSELELRLKELEQLAGSPSTPPDREREVDAIQWVEDHAFYLNAQQCICVNAWIKRCDSHPRSPSVQIIRKPLI